MFGVRPRTRGLIKVSPHLFFLEVRLQICISKMWNDFDKSEAEPPIFIDKDKKCAKILVVL